MHHLSNEHEKNYLCLYMRIEKKYSLFIYENGRVTKEKKLLCYYSLVSVIHLVKWH